MGAVARRNALTPTDLFHDHQHIAAACVSKYARGAGQHRDDITQHAMAGLWRACQTWDGSLHFAPYAAQRVRWAIADGWRAIDHMPDQARRAVRAGAADAVTLVALGSWDAPLPDIADRIADRLDIDAALEAIDWWPAFVVRRYYLDDATPGMIAAEVERSVSWVMYRKAEGLAALRALSQGPGGALGAPGGS